MVLVFALKEYIYFDQARQQAGNSQTIIVEKMVQSNELLTELYSGISLQLLEIMGHPENLISNSDVIKVLFELSQKKVIRPFIVNDIRVQNFFKNLDYKKLS